MQNGFGNLFRGELRALLIVGIFAAPALATDATWNTTTGDWSVGGKWTSTPLNNVAPTTSADNATVNTTSADPTLDGSFTINNFTFSDGKLDALLASDALTIDGTFAWTGGTIDAGTTINATSLTISNALSNNGTLNVTNFNLSLGDDLIGGSLTTSGQFNWTDGEMEGPGTTTLNSTSTMSLSASSNVSLSNRDLVNNGTITWSGTGTVNVQSGATWTNNGEMDATNNATIEVPTVLTTGTEKFTNAGTFKKSGGTGTTTILVPFDNSGTVSVSTGKLSIQGAGTGTGTFDISTGGTLEFGADKYTLNSGVSINNTGGTLSNIKYLRAPAAALIGNNLNFNAPLLGELFVDGDLPAADFTWTAGVLNGSGTTVTDGTTVPAQWSVGGGRTLELSNGGTINWSGTWGQGIVDHMSLFDDSQPGTIHNLGTFKSAADLGLSAAPQLFVMNNANNFEATSNSTVFGQFNNTGTVAIDSNVSLELASGGSSSGSFSGGTGSTLTFSGTATHALTSGATVSVPSVSTSATIFNLDNGASVTPSTFAMNGGTANINGTLNAGEIDVNSGEMIVNSGSSVTGTTTNISDTLHITSGATVHGGTYTQTGLLHLDGGTLTATGTASITGGGIFGKGTVDADVSVTSGGSIVPSNIIITPPNTQLSEDIGTISITHSLTMDNTSELGFELDADPMHTDHADLLSVGGGVDLNGAQLEVVLFNPSQLSPSDVFTIVTGTIDGQFSDGTNPITTIQAVDPGGTPIDATFNINYNADSITLTPVPEPGIALILALGSVLLHRPRTRVRGCEEM